MSRVQKLRSLVNQRLAAAVEEIFGLFERTIEAYEEECSCSKEDNDPQRKLLDAICVSTHSLKMSRVQMLRVLVNQRLTAAVEETFGLIEETIEEYEEEIDGWRRRLEDVVKPEIQIQKADSPQLFVCKVEQDQEDTEPRHIKEEQEELWTSQEGLQLQGPEEADITKFPFTPVPVKSEDDEEKPQSSQAEPLASTSTEQMKTEADGEDCRASESSSNLDPASDVQPTNDGQLLPSDYSESETEDSDDDWKDTSEAQPGLDLLKNKKIPVSPKRSDASEKTFSCTVCGKSFSFKGHLKTHMRLHSGFGYKGSLQRHMISHTGGKPFSCLVCGKRFGLKECLQRHMILHTGEKPFSCLVCGKRFSQSGAVSTHMRSHTGGKPFSCSVCNNSFTRRGTLVRHMRIHTGERLCVCLKRFSRLSNVRSHKYVNVSNSR